MYHYDLLIFGATRNTGLHIAQQAKAQGLRVAAMVRHGGDISSLNNIDIDIFEGDAFELEECKNVISQTQPKWIVSVLGGKNAQGRRVDAEGNINVIHAAYEQVSLTRFLLLTSMGSGEQYENTSEHVKKFLGEALRAKTLAEEELQKSQLPWVIIRPCGLNHDDATGNFHLSERPDNRYETYMPRADVATAVLKVLHEEQWLCKTLTLQGCLKQEEIHAKN